MACGSENLGFSVNLFSRLASGQILPAAIVFAFAFGVYADSLANGFVHDDIGQVVLNTLIRSFRYLPSMFASSVASAPAQGHVLVKSNFYRPVMYLIYMVCYAVSGLKPWSFHLMNVLLHGAASVAAYFAALAIIGRQDGRFNIGPFFTALIFAAHPVHTEDVAWVAAVPDIFYSFLLLVAFLFWQKDESSKGALASAALFLVACFTKETALVLPLIFFLYDLCAKRIFGAGRAGILKALKRYWPLAAVLLVYMAMRINALHGMAPQSHFKYLSGAAIFANALWLFAQYLYKLAAPLNLNADHEFHPISATDPRAFIGLLAASAFIFFAFWAIKKRPVIFMGMVFIAAPVLPVLYAPVLGSNVFAERYLYLPVFGFALIIANVFMYIRGRWRPSLALALAAVLTASYSWAAAERNLVWKSQLSLWSDTVRKTPDAALPNMNMGRAYLDAGRPALALPYLQKAAALVPDYAKGHSLLGQALAGVGRTDDAIKQFQETIELDPGRYEAWGDLGTIYAGRGDFQRALFYLDKAKQANSQCAAVYVTLGELYLKTGQRDKAAENYLKAASLEPGNAAYKAEAIKLAGGNR